MLSGAVTSWLKIDLCGDTSISATTLVEILSSTPSFYVGGSFPMKFTTTTPSMNMTLKGMDEAAAAAAAAAETILGLI